MQRRLESMKKRERDAKGAESFPFLDVAIISQM